MLRVKMHACDSRGRLQFPSNAIAFTWTRGDRYRDCACARRGCDATVKVADLGSHWLVDHRRIPFGDRCVASENVGVSERVTYKRSTVHHRTKYDTTVGSKSEWSKCFSPHPADPAADADAAPKDAARFGG